MYRAKARGTGQFEIFDRTMHADALARLQLETDMRRALEREEFRLHYQPVIELATGRMVGVKPAGGIKTSKDAIKFLVTVHEIAGEGEPLLLMHGLGSCTADWAPQIERFRHDYAVVLAALLLRKFFEAPPPENV